MANRRPSLALLLFAALLLILLTAAGAAAFGAGNIPSYAWLEGRAVRHGDIEDILAELYKKVGSGMLSRSSKFGGLDIKRVYFGNWLRDYSQAMDIAALKKLNKQTIITLCMALGFLAHGYATAEFEVTEERLGVYLPTEHIDNPKGYGEGEDPRRYNPNLRPPVDRRELEIDPRTGIKNYIANESGHWDTSSALIRRTIAKCIDHARRFRNGGRKEDEYEAFRLLGQLLHTLEGKCLAPLLAQPKHLDLPAHSNWCELALIQLGHRNVFSHVGDHVRVQAPNGQSVAPLVTGTFGSADFIHSLLGEATDHLSEASVSDLSKAIDGARARSMAGGTSRSAKGSSGINVTSLLNQLASVPGVRGGELSRDASEVNVLSEGPSRDPMTMSPQEIHETLWKIFELRDRIVKTIEVFIEKIPGLRALVQKVHDAITVWVFTAIDPYIKPLMKQATEALQKGSSQVINKEDQYEVFNNPNASDPTHSILSKDHFGLFLNEVAGNVAKIIVRHAVTKIVAAWDDPSIDPRRVGDECLEAMFHPAWYDGRSKVQKDMLDYIAQWAGQNPDLIELLSKNHVRAGRNRREEGGQGHAHGHLPHAPAPHAPGGYNAPPPSSYGGGGGPSNDSGGFNFPQPNVLFGGGGGSPWGNREGSSYAPPNEAPPGSYAPPHGIPDAGSGSYLPPLGPPLPGGGVSPYGGYEGQPSAYASSPSPYGPASYGGGYPSGPPSGPGGYGMPQPQAPLPPGQEGYPGAPGYGPPPGYPPYGGGGQQW